MRIGINGLLLSTESGYRQSGIDRYLRGLLSALPGALAQPPLYRSSAIHDDSTSSEAVVIDGDVTSKRHDTLIVYARAHSIDPNGQFILREAPALSERRTARVAWEQIGLPRAIAADRLDLFHGAAFALPYRLSSPAVVTIHDLAFLRWPEQVPRRRGLYLSRAVRSAAARAERVIAVSEATRRDVIELLEVAPERVDVTYLGVDPLFRRTAGEAIAAFRHRYELTHPFILAVGTREPRKNLPALVRAFASLRDQIPHDLIHVGGAGWLSAELEQAIADARLGDRLRFIDFVPHDELPLWYSAADCFVLPSLYEGFGLPLLEAMACGAPCIASNRSSLPEVGGDAALFCEPDPPAIAEALLPLLHDGELRQRLRERGPSRAARFTWERTATATVDSYRKALDGH